MIILEIIPFASPTEHPLEIFDISELIPSMFDLSGLTLSILLGITISLGAAKIISGFFKNSF